MRYPTLSLTCWLALHTLLHALAAENASPATLPLFRVVDLNRGEAAQITLSDGKKVNIKLLEVDETRDAVRSAVRLARVSVEINGRNMIVASSEAKAANRSVSYPSKRHADGFNDWVLVADGH